MIDADGQITVGTGVTFDAAVQATYAVTVTADDGSGEANATATIDVTITVGTVPPIILPPIGIGGGGGGPSGPTPSAEDFEWTVTRDIEELDGGNDWPTGLWSDGAVLWLAENGQGADDEVYAYDIESGERAEDREFELHETNRAPRGFWSDRATVWVSDSGQDRLFAYDLARGERLEGREFEPAERNRDARGIWSDGTTMWVLDGGKNSLFAYDLESGELLAEYHPRLRRRRPPRHLVRQRHGLGLQPRPEATLRLPPAGARGRGGRGCGRDPARARARGGVHGAPAGPPTTARAASGRTAR